MQAGEEIENTVEINPQANCFPAKKSLLSSEEKITLRYFKYISLYMEGKSLKVPAKGP